MMGLNLTGIFDVLDKLLETGENFVKAQVETAYGALHNHLKERAEKTETKFDDNGLIAVECGIRDKLNELYPADEFPPRK